MGDDAGSRLRGPDSRLRLRSVMACSTGGGGRVQGSSAAAPFVFVAAASPATTKVPGRSEEMAAEGGAAGARNILDAAAALSTAGRAADDSANKLRKPLLPPDAPTAVAQDARDIAIIGPAPATNKPLPHSAAGQARGLLSFCYHPMSPQATTAFLKQAADASVMGLVTLSCFFATYLLAWGPAGSTCIPPAPKPDKDADPNWLQLWVPNLAAALPFLVFPLTLFVSALVQAAEKDGHALGFVAAMCLLEFVGSIAIGCGMMFCMSGWSQIWYVACVIIVLIVLTKGFTFKYPAFLRRFIWSTCCHQDEVVVQAVNQ